MERFCLDNLQNHLEIVSGKIGEYFQICDNLNREIRQIEDRTNEQIDHDKELFQTEIEESMSQIDEYLSSAMNYADTIMTSINTSKMYLENQTKNMELYWQQAEQVGDIRVPEYSSEPASSMNSAPPRRWSPSSPTPPSPPSPSLSIAAASTPAAAISISRASVT